ncbi:O-methyltransferase [Corynebacterium sp. HMSC28B08]|uniref:O-methyltransferase n=1 Tax=Corynebacterium sp. HMSC28B08 TaxID=1581066 RepID=UPI0008A3412F|nr:methyltransferase [Corynebacterium sp. HMSC28B08]OFT90760.1 methyltransferase [Corynebacterium sp. HMSC28B08]
MNASSATPEQAIVAHVNRTTNHDEALLVAIEAAEEFGLMYPDTITGEFLTFLAAHAGSSATLAGHTPTAIVMSSASGVVGSYLFAGMSDGHLTCIEPEVQYQQLAKEAFAASGKRPNSFRFLPSSPLDVVSRLAQESYDLAVAEAHEEDLIPLVRATLPALRPGGLIVLMDTLVDGLIGDESRTDRQTTAAREADEFFRELEGVQVSRLPLGAGLTLLTKVSAPQN